MMYPVPCLAHFQCFQVFINRTPCHSQSHTPCAVIAKPPPSSSHDSVALARWRAGRRLITSCATICGLRRLELDAVLLLVVRLVRAAAAIVAGIAVGIGGGGRVGWSRLLRGVVVVVVVVRLRGVVSRPSSPPGAVEGLTACLAAATRCETAVGDVSAGWLKRAMDRLTCRARRGRRSRRL
jgi:hypothetical protein